MPNGEGGQWLEDRDKKYLAKSKHGWNVNPGKDWKGIAMFIAALAGLLSAIGFSFDSVVDLISPKMEQIHELQRQLEECQDVE